MIMLDIAEFTVNGWYGMTYVSEDDLSKRYYVGKAITKSGRDEDRKIPNILFRLDDWAKNVPVADWKEMLKSYGFIDEVDFAHWELI